MVMINKYQFAMYMYMYYIGQQVNRRHVDVLYRQRESEHYFKCFYLISTKIQIYTLSKMLC